MLNERKHGLPVHCGNGMRRYPYYRQMRGDFDRVAIITEWLQDAHCAEWCSEYGEPGYTQPETGVILANWNNIPKAFADLLEEKGYSLEWSDEWVIDYDHSKAYRTSPDSYGRESSVVYADGEMLTRDDSASDIIEEVAMTDWNQGAAIVPSWIEPQDLIDAGYVRHPSNDAPDFESGFFPGQNDDPAAIVKAIWNEPGPRVERAVFRRTEQSQFYTRFEVWVLYETEEESI